jgi:ubiquinol-cytochrome c reductase iron-sulfur subunit
MSTHRGREGEEARATRSALLGFVASAVGAVVFVAAYVRGADTQWMGIGLLFALGGIGYGLVVWAHRLMPPGGEVEDRELMSDPEGQKSETADWFEDRLANVQRRKVLGGALATALGATGLAAIVPLRSLGPAPGEALRRTDFAKVPRPRLVTEDGTPVHRRDLPVRGFLTVYPEGYPGSADAQTVLIRLADDVHLRPPTRTDWVVDGYIAYSKVCTHAGCSVGEYQVEYQSLVCPCHQSAFRVEEGGEPFMGPAARPLPQLPLGLDDEGYLIALGDYPEAVGPGWWSRP